MRPGTVLLMGAAIALACAVPGVALAQYPGQFQYGNLGHSDNPNGPTVSPYLNLLQNNQQLNAVPTYQSLVKPLMDQNAAIQRQGSSLQQLQQQVNTPSSLGPNNFRSTGHGSDYFNYSRFYSRSPTILHYYSRRPMGR